MCYCVLDNVSVRSYDESFFIKKIEVSEFGFFRIEFFFCIRYMSTDFGIIINLISYMLDWYYREMFEREFKNIGHTLFLSLLTRTQGYSQKSEKKKNKNVTVYPKQNKVRIL